MLNAHTHTCIQNIFFPSLPVTTLITKLHGHKHKVAPTYATYFWAVTLTTRCPRAPLTHMHTAHTHTQHSHTHIHTHTHTHKHTPFRLTHSHIFLPPSHRSGRVDFPFPAIRATRTTTTTLVNERALCKKLLASWSALITAAAAARVAETAAKA